MQPNEVNLKAEIVIHTYFGSGGPSARGFMESLHRERNTRKASFCRMWEKRAALWGPCRASASWHRWRKTVLLFMQTALIRPFCDVTFPKFIVDEPKIWPPNFTFFKLKQHGRNRMLWWLKQILQPASARLDRGQHVCIMDIFQHVWERPTEGLHLSFPMSGLSPEIQTSQSPIWIWEGRGTEKENRSEHARAVCFRCIWKGFPVMAPRQRHQHNFTIFQQASQL